MAWTFLETVSLGGRSAASLFQHACPLHAQASSRCLRLLCLQQQQLLEAAACRATEAEAKLVAALHVQREAERRLQEEGGSGKDERRRGAGMRRTLVAHQLQHAGAADAARRLATQQVAAAAAAEHVAAVDAALAQLLGPLAAGLPTAAVAAVSAAASRAQAAASDLARLLQQQAQLEEQLLAVESPADLGEQAPPAWPCSLPASPHGACCCALASLQPALLLAAHAQPTPGWHDTCRGLHSLPPGFHLRRRRCLQAHSRRAAAAGCGLAAWCCGRPSGRCSGLWNGLEPWSRVSAVAQHAACLGGPVEQTSGAGGWLDV